MRMTGSGLPFESVGRFSCKPLDLRALAAGRSGSCFRLAQWRGRLVGGLEGGREGENTNVSELHTQILLM